MKEYINAFPEIVVLRRADYINDQEMNEMWTWAGQVGLVWQKTITFKNHWTKGDSDPGGHYYSFEITDEKLRMMFILRWK